jgi:5-methyltetrahydrofolate corrinoid/iron sulfur protein methyltransferase
MQDKQTQVLDFIHQLRDMGFNSTGGLSNVSNMMPKHIRPIMDSVTVAMAINNGGLSLT